MNLIFELAEQASHQSPDGYPVTIPYSKDFVKKFAELIINEGISRIASWRDATDEEMLKLDHWKGYQSGCDDAIVELKSMLGL